MSMEYKSQSGTVESLQAEISKLRSAATAAQSDQERTLEALKAECVI